MSENRDEEIPSPNDEDINIETHIPTSEGSADQIPTKEDEQMVTSGGVFQELLRKFQEISNSEDDRPIRIRQGISLGGELIEIIDKATPDDSDDFQKCFQLLREEILAFQSMVYMGGEKLFLHDIFFALLDLLSKPEIRSCLNNNQAVLMFHQKFYIRLTNWLLTSASDVARYIPIMKEDIVMRKYTDTLCAMCNRVKYDLQSNIETEQPINLDTKTIDRILSFLVNMTDRTIIIEWFLDSGFVKVMLECLQTIDLTSERARLIIGIIYNIVRHDDGANELAKVDGPRILKDIQRKCVRELDADNDLTISMAVSLLSTSEQIRADNKRMNRILNQLLQITITAAEAEDHREGGYHVSEPLAVFTKLFVDDHSLEYVLSHAETDPPLTVSSTIALFIKLFIEFQSTSSVDNQQRHFTRMALLNILWSISFQDRYKTKLQQNKDFLTIVKSLAISNEETVVDQYIPRSMESMATAANGILHNLNETTDRKDAVPADKPFVTNTSSGKPMVMISYAHDNNPFCDKILAEFAKNNDLFEVWIDRDHCSSSEDLWEKIARGIRQSNLVICLLSQDYFNSKSCRKEASFAVQRRKAIIPIYIGEPGDCDWLDIHIAGLKYVRFKDNTNELDRAKAQELLKTIEATIKETQTQPAQQQKEQHAVPAPPPPRQGTQTTTSITFDMKKPPEEWTTDDIHRWFDSHKVPDTLVKLFDFQSFTEMQEYSEKLSADPNKEFAKYEQRYAKHHGDELEEYKFNRFKNALFSLTNKHSRAEKTPLSSDQAPRPKSSACTIS